MYLCIQNPGVCPIEGFTILGVSSSRSRDEAIGQFGSGNKHAINLLLRANMGPHIFCGTKSLKFFTKPSTMTTDLGETDYNSVHYNLDGEIKDLNFALEFGELDWQDLTMALREFVSNAIDRTIEEFGTHVHDSLVIDVVEIPTAKAGCTRVFVPFSQEVQKFYNELGTRFLHFYKDGSYVNDKIIKTAKERHGRLYRKGVLIRLTDQNAFFDYNFGSELKIDECRNLSDYAARVAAVSHICKTGTDEQLDYLFRGLTCGRHKDSFEAHFSSYDVDLDGDDKTRILKAWVKVAGDRVLVALDDGLIEERCRDRGYTTICVWSVGWQDILEQCGARSSVDVLTKHECDGRMISTATTAATQVLNEVWNKLWACGLINAYAEKPSLKCFTTTTPLQGRKKTLGLWIEADQEILIDKDTAASKTPTLYAVMLEEIAHMITGSDDCSRDLQSYAFTAAVKLGGFCDMGIEA